MSFNYFFSNILVKENESNSSFIKGFSILSIPRIGDCLKIYFSHRGSFFFTEGLLVSISKKGFFTPETTLILYSKIKHYKLKFSFSFFYNLLFSFEKLEYKNLKKSNYVPHS